MRGYFSEGEPLGDQEVVVRLAVDVGLDEAKLRAVAFGDEYGTDVRADESRARSMGVSGVPAFLIGGKYLVSGAQPAETLLEVLERALTDVGAPRE